LLDLRFAEGLLAFFPFGVERFLPADLRFAAGLLAFFPFAVERFLAADIETPFRASPQNCRWRVATLEGDVHVTLKRSGD
jgi:hypothetical protein